MKSLLFTLLFAPFLACAQMQPVAPTNAQLSAGVEAKAPFKGANVILVHTTDSTAVALKKISRALVLAGMEPDRIDTEIGYMTTKARAVGSINPATYTYKVVCAAEPGGSVLRITGTLSYTMKLMIVPVTESMRWTPNGNGNGKGCFTAVEAAAISYAGARIGYKQENTEIVLH